MALKITTEARTTKTELVNIAISDMFQDESGGVYMRIDLVLNDSNYYTKLDSGETFSGLDMPPDLMVTPRQGHLTIS